MNNQLTNTKLFPYTTLIVYRTKAEYGAKFYIERRDFLNGKLAAAVPLDESTIKEVAQLYIKSDGAQMEHDPVIPEHILHAHHSIVHKVVVWYRPAMKRMLNIAADRLAKTINKQVNVPATLYAVVNKELYVFALNSSKRPDQKTKLFHAPFYNVYEGGNVCRGTAFFGSKGRTFTDETERYERGFYMAEQNMQSHSKAAKISLNQLWTKAQQNDKPFDVKMLVPHGKFKTLGEFINAVGKKARR